VAGPGTPRRDALVSTDLAFTAEQVLEGTCERWSTEESFGWVKSRPRFDAPHNRTAHALERSAPMAPWSYPLVVAWHARWARRRRVLPSRAGS
jgi:hypothetical protein